MICLLHLICLFPISVIYELIIFRSKKFITSIRESINIGDKNKLNTIFVKYTCFFGLPLFAVGVVASCMLLFYKIPEDNSFYNSNITAFFAIFSISTILSITAVFIIIKFFDKRIPKSKTGYNLLNYSRSMGVGIIIHTWTLFMLFGLMICALLYIVNGIAF